MVVFHGTSEHAVPLVSRDGLLVKKHNHVRRKCACTSLEFKVAEVFAIRRTPADDFIAGKISGVVLEFHLRGQIGSDYEAVIDSRSLQEESEIAVYVPSRLQLIAVWKHDQKWIRHPLV